ncbi:hypothetical protein HOK51_05770 [Candidatus Woesearchaeota archaeon]|jgi:hypothetical protein|nr:hypothetical protein [Candidatus Woesearchaeota archaeon]MBT6519337.1 hypothetical protein [Candidatus Woesearchaeota archaeon]
MLYKINDPNFIKLVEKEIPLDRLEQRLRPKLGLEDSDAEYKAHDNYRDFSGEGFLGKDESLLEVIHSDWQILSKYKTTHAEIANALEKVVAGDYALHPDYEFRDDGMASLGTQGCPWYCGVNGQNTGVITKKNLTDDEEQEAIFIQLPLLLGKNSKEDYKEIIKIKQDIKKRLKSGPTIYAPITDLLPHLIRDHYFFEGKDVPYRADPEFLIKALNLGLSRFETPIFTIYDEATQTTQSQLTSDETEEIVLEELILENPSEFLEDTKKEKKLSKDSNELTEAEMNAARTWGAKIKFGFKKLFRK